MEDRSEERWEHVIDVDRDPLRFDSDITHGHIAADERLLFLRTSNGALYTVDLDGGATARGQRLEASLSFGGYLTDARALVWGTRADGSQGAWIIDVVDSLAAWRTASEEAPISACVAPDHRSSTMLFCSGEAVVIDRDATRLRSASCERSTERARVVALSAERALILREDDSVDAHEWTANLRWSLPWEAWRVGPAVDDAHVLYFEDERETPAEQRTFRCSIRRWSDGVTLLSTGACRVVAGDRAAPLMVATRADATFSLTGRVLSLREGAQAEAWADCGRATLAFSARWRVIRSGPPMDDGPAAVVLPRESPPSEADSRWPEQLALSPDGSTLIVLRFGTLSAWNTRDGSLVDDLREPLATVACNTLTSFVRGGTVFGLSYHCSMPWDDSGERGVQFYELDASGLRVWATLLLDPSCEQRTAFAGCAQDGRAALVLDGIEGRLYEWPLDESTRMFTAEGARQIVLDARITEARYNADGAIEVLAGNRWLRREGERWVEPARIFGDSVRFVGAGVSAMDRESGEGLVFSRDADVRSCIRADGLWSSAAFVRVFVASRALWVTDVARAIEWGPITLESERGGDLVAISADAATIAALDGPSVKVFRRTRA